MKYKRWYFTLLLSMFLVIILLLFSSMRESSSNTSTSAKGIMTSSTETSKVTSESTNHSNLQTNTPIDSVEKVTQTAISTESEVYNQEQTTTTELTKPNPPISQEVIQRLQKEQQNKSGEIYRLNVAQQVQRAWNTCAPTTVSMMLSSQGITISQEQLADEMGTDTVFGTHNANAIKVLNRHLFGYDTPNSNQPGYRIAVVTTDDVNSDQMALFKERLKQNIADGYPLYYTFDNSKIYPGKSSGEHNVIGTGYQLTADGTDIAYIYYIDPSYLQQDSVYGGLKKITPQELFTAMLTCVEPNYAW